MEPTPVDDEPLEIKRRRPKGVWNAEEQRYVPRDPYKSAWYIEYVRSNGVMPESEHRKFRRRFRVPHHNVRELWEEAKREGWWLPFGGRDATGVIHAPTELLLLGALRYMGRGWTFDDLEEPTQISETTHNRFYHKFIEWGSTIFLRRHVRPPEDEQAARLHMIDFEKAGMPGAIGSTDASHAIMARCPMSLKNMHMGAKMPFATRSYNVTVNNRRE